LKYGSNPNPEWEATMTPLQVKAVPSDLRLSIPQLIRDFKAALSYVSFYSSDSPFVIQAVSKCHKDLYRILQACGSLALHLKEGKVFLNDADISEVGDLPKIFQDKNTPGVEIFGGLTMLELNSWMKQITLPIFHPDENPEAFANIRPLPHDVLVMVLKEEPPVPAATAPEEKTPAYSQPLVASPTPAPAPAPFKPTFSEFSKQRVVSSAPEARPSPEAAKVEASPLDKALNTLLPDAEPKTFEGLLAIVAEAWQFSQAQKKNLGNGPEMASLAQSFDKLFDRLLDRMEKTSPEFANIHQWFKTPEGDLLDSQVAASMVPLLEAAVNNRWSAVLFDPATEGLVSECLAFWGANGKQDLVEKTVDCLAEGLKGDSLERQLALAHLMDARPWVHNAELLRRVLNPLNSLLTDETTPGLYQTALLLAWDLLEPALDAGGEKESLTLLSILHFHAEEDSVQFPGRARIARHWLFERSTPKLVRRLVYSAAQEGQLHQFPLLGELAAPLLLEDFFAADAGDKGAYLRFFAEIKEPIRSALAERMAAAKEEEEVGKLIPVLRACGMDPALSLQLSSWLSRGSRAWKLGLLGVIEEVGDPGAGPALRLALFDDEEEIAARAARLIGKIRFAPGLTVLMKAAKIRESRYSQNDSFLASVCRALGDLGSPEGVPFLQDIARKKPLLRGKNFALPVRLAAIEALTHINKPEVWNFLGDLMEEKNPALQETLDRIIHDKIQAI
jgi:hypothetical protein